MSGKVLSPLSFLSSSEPLAYSSMLANTWQPYDHGMLIEFEVLKNFEKCRQLMATFKQFLEQFQFCSIVDQKSYL